MGKSRGRCLEVSEEELVLGALLGEIEAFDALVLRYRGAVTRIARQILGSQEAAEDLAQEALLLAFKALPQLQEPSHFAGWLCAITRHRARRVAIREQRAEPTEASRLDQLLLTQSQALTLHPEQELIRKSENALVPEALAQLPSEHRLVMELRYYEEWPVAQIADFLQLPLTTVKWRLHRGRALLRRLLTEPKETLHGNERTADSGTLAHTAPAA